jgi:hypothetical protein
MRKLIPLIPAVLSLGEFIWLAVVWAIFWPLVGDHDQWPPLLAALFWILALAPCLAAIVIGYKSAMSKEKSTSFSSSRIIAILGALGGLAWCCYFISGIINKIRGN